jgi:ATP-binding cassette subfamily C protein
MMRLVGLVRPLAGFMVCAIVLGLLGNLCASFVTVLAVCAVCELIGVGTFPALYILFAGMIIAAVIRGALRYGEQSCNHYIAFKLLAIIRDKVFGALRRLTPAKLEGKNKGDLISTITTDIELLEVFYAHTISPTVIAVLFGLVMCMFIGQFSWLLALIAVVSYVCVAAVPAAYASKKSSRVAYELRQNTGAMSGFMLDSLRGLPELLQFGATEARAVQMHERINALAQNERAYKEATGANMALSGALVLVCALAMFAASSALYMQGAVGFEGVLVPTVALLSSFGPSIALANLGSTLQSTIAAGNRVLDVLDETPIVHDVTGKPATTSFTGAKVEHVTFAYPKNPQSAEGEEGTLSAQEVQGAAGACDPAASDVILDDVSLDIRPGEVVGIVGKSGSGKSTLLKLLMRFWQANEGKIEISGKSIDDINTDDLRAIEAYVAQDTHLFHDSIRNNLLVAKPDATDDELVAACKKASIYDFVQTLPQGIDTPVEELGESLSGGERQRLGLARAFLHDGDFMLLDEPTSNLDSLNEAVILRALATERASKTICIVSHRPSTVTFADRKITMNASKIGQLS